MNLFDSQSMNVPASQMPHTVNAAQAANEKIRNDTKDAMEFNMAMTADSVKSDEILKMLTQTMKAASSMNI